jgi:putative MFS transporter
MSPIPSPRSPNDALEHDYEVTSKAWSKFRVSKAETRRGTVMAFLAMALGTFDFILFGTMLPVVQEDFGWSEAYASGVATSIAIGTTLAVFLIGPITDRLGRRKGMLLTVSATALASAATAATMNVAYLIGVRSVGGVAVGEQAVNTAYLNEIYALSEDKAITKRRGFIYGIVQSGWPMGTFLAAAFAAVLLPFFDWRVVFLIATFPAILVILARRKLKETPQFLIQRKLQAKPEEYGRTFHCSVHELVRHPNFQCSRYVCANQWPQHQFC